MIRFSFRLKTATFLFLGFLLNAPTVALTQDILMVRRESRLYASDGDELVARNVLRPETLVGIWSAQPEESGDRLANNRSLVFVRTLQPIDRRKGWVDGVDEGWVPRRNLVNVSALSRGYLGARPGGVYRDRKTITTTPELIQCAGNQLQRKWWKIQNAIAASSTWRESLPSLYLSRAEVWEAVGHYRAALDDYSIAARLTKSSARRDDMARIHKKFFDLLKIRRWSVRPLDVPSDDILIIQRETRLYVSEHGKLVAKDALQRATLVTILLAIRSGQAKNEKLVFVRTLEPLDLRIGWRDGIDQGWGLAENLMNVSALSQGFLASRPIAMVEQAANGTPPRIHQASEELQRDWRRTQKAVVRNEKSAKPLPGPYLARGIIWEAVHDSEAALDDYLKAAQLMERRARPGDINGLYKRIYDVLKSRQVSSHPPRYADAWQHYGHGYHLYWSGQLKAALKHFDYAIHLGPNTSLVRYYRALARKRLGRHKEAEHDVIVGFNLETRLLDPYTYREPGGPVTFFRNGRAVVRVDTSYINRALERVQGPNRLWLEEYKSKLRDVRR